MFFGGSTQYHSHERKHPEQRRPLDEAPDDQSPYIATNRGRGTKERQTEIPREPRRIRDTDHGHSIGHDEGTADPRQCAHGVEGDEVVAEPANEREGDQDDAPQ